MYQVRFLRLANTSSTYEFDFLTPPLHLSVSSTQTFGSGNLKRVGVILQRGILILLLACFPCWAILINTEPLLLAVKQSPEVARSVKSSSLTVLDTGFNVIFDNMWEFR